MSKTKRSSIRENFKQFVFTSSGDLAQPGKMDRIGVYDNAVAELDRLGALVHLLATSGDEIPEGVQWGLSLLLGDIHKRLERILDELTGTGSRRG